MAKNRKLTRQQQQTENNAATPHDSEYGAIHTSVEQTTLGLSEERDNDGKTVSCRRHVEVLRKC